MIEVAALHRTFGRHRVLRDVSFSVPAGRVAGFLGPNGAGKTTTMRILTTILPPDPGSGRVIVAGHDVSEHPREVCRRVGYLPESMPIHPELRVGEYLRYRARLKGLRGATVGRRLGEAMETCGLTDVERRTCGVLSKGYRQRVGLADALLGEPEVLILDEPTSGLDPAQIGEVRQLVARLRERATILLSSHVLGEVEQLCDLVVILGDGTVRGTETREGWTRRLERAGRLELRLLSPPKDVVTRLRSLPGVSAAERGDGDDGAPGVLFRITAGSDAGESVFRLAAERGWRLVELARRPATFESMFLEVVGDRGGSP